MKYLVVIATMVACCIAMPALQDRPTPINPSVLSEPKPTGKPTPSEDAKDDQSPVPFYPTALPAEISHHISKRDHKPGHDSHPVAKPEVPEPFKKSPAPVAPINASLKPHSPPSPAIKLPEQKRNRRDVQKVELQKPQTLPALIPHNDHNDATKVQQGYHAATIGLQKPQTLPATLYESEKHKRDAPVPFAATHEQSKTSSQTNKGEEHSKVDNTKFELQKPQTLPALIPHNDHNDGLKVQQGYHAATIGLQKPQTLPATLYENEKHKRDAPVPFAATHEQTKTSSQTSKVEDKKEEQKATEPSHNPNVQVEDLSDHKAGSHHKLSASKLPHDRDHKHPSTDEQKPVTLGDIQQKPNTNKLTAESSTEHPLIRPKPVPVSELFSRHQDN